jgi:hypothetical protein
MNEHIRGRPFLLGVISLSMDWMKPLSDAW